MVLLAPEMCIWPKNKIPHLPECYCTRHRTQNKVHCMIFFQWQTDISMCQTCKFVHKNARCAETSTVHEEKQIRCSYVQ